MNLGSGFRVRGCGPDRPEPGAPNPERERPEVILIGALRVRPRISRTLRCGARRLDARRDDRAGTLRAGEEVPHAAKRAAAATHCQTLGWADLRRRAALCSRRHRGGGDMPDARASGLVGCVLATSTRPSSRLARLASRPSAGHGKFWDALLAALRCVGLIG